MDDRFSTTVSRDGDATVISVAGEIDVATCERLRDAIEPHLGPQQTIILDLSGVEFMDSASLKVLVHARGTLTADRPMADLTWLRVKPAPSPVG